eukprot:TRINITY_DN9553_c0_g1_i3.p1 TRINITY_DN9553_c0_g1~~TRINITY_DN9553_c0_g1_i3.p1  ORF type:complete len:176 (+),score=34.45 TRINITY_DN9553_c0_g1_i3:69-596(+)
MCIRDRYMGSVCDNFSIDLTEFEQIFGSNESTFVIWDTDNNGLIDALELFSGLILFADAKFEDKMRFLFDLFDFNGLNSLAAIDVEFMINSCVLSTYKIFSINSEIYDEELSAFVGDAFAEDARVNITQFIKWASETPEIGKFFDHIKRDLPTSKLSGDAVKGKLEGTILPKSGV